MTACLRGLDARHRERGFTLVEIAIAIFIITLLLGSFLVPLTTQVEQRQVSETQKMLEDIKEALIGHAIAKGYLPCPDRTSGGAGTIYDTANDGVEDYITGTGICFSTTLSGNVPWVTLGLGASDPWGNRFRYRVTAAYGQRPVLPGPPPTPALFNLSTAATLGVTTTSGGTLLTAANPDGAVAVILSHGKNGYGAMNAQTNILRPNPPAANSDESDNQGGTTYTSRVPTVIATPCGAVGQPLCEFDDIVIWMGKYTLFQRMVAAGKLP